MKVLIIKASALGDVIHALPVLAWLKSADATLEIDWLVEEGFAPVLEDHPLLNRVIRLQTKRWRRTGALTSLRGAWSMLRELRDRAYDVVLDLQGNSKSGLFTRGSGAPVRYGFARNGVREWANLLATNRKVALDEQDFHITDRSLAIAKAAFPEGTEARPAGPLPVDTEAAARVEAGLKEAGLNSGPLVVLHYGTTWVTKLWPLESWQELSRRLVREKGVRPVLTWGNDTELAAVEAIRKACGDECFIWPRGSLKELIALLARADLVVGGDTGPIHIAAAVQTPTVSLFRVTDASRNAPRGAIHLNLSAEMDCAPCLRKECDRDDECGHSINVDSVYRLITRQLEHQASQSKGP